MVIDFIVTITYTHTSIETHLIGTEVIFLMLLEISTAIESDGNYSIKERFGAGLGA